ncbi:MAG: hypothetical protein ABIE55_01485 [Candidatus Aenigmatarchaeota archaeon]
MMVAVVIFTISYRRLSKGEFKKILKWLLLGFYFMVIPYSLFVSREIGLLEEYHETISLTIYSFMVITGLCILKSSFVLNNFSKIFGFADIGEEFSKTFTDNSKNTSKRKEEAG